MPRYVLALDQGTTTSRSILFDHDGNMAAVAQKEFAQHFPRPGWVEHDPDEIWASQAATVAEVMALADATPADVAAVGIANQRETTLLWDRATGRPVAPAIVWQDRRTAAVCDRLREDGREPEIVERTGLLIDPYFSGTKLAWLLDNVAGARDRAERGELAFGTVDSWLVYKLSEHRLHVTDATNASRTQLYNLATGDWDDRMLELLRIPRACLPQIVPSLIRPDHEARGGALEAMIEGRPVPLAGIGGDQQAALFGQACFEPGMAKNTYGTGCFMLMNGGTQPPVSHNRLLSTVAWDDGKVSYALEGSVFVAGAVVQWLRDGLGFIRESSEVEALARSVPDSDGVYLVPAFTGLGSPHWDAHARGVMVGLTRGTTRGHVARAALEGIAFQSAEVLDAMRRDAGHPLVELRVDGGATVNDLLMQFQADLLGVPVVRPRIRETTALGAAYLAGLATGFWGSREEVAGKWQAERTFEPRMSRDEAEARMHGWSRAVERARAWSD
ncbi:MAG: glycerol kinase [Gammaproteobacteria bacterium SG8_30]|jgi:glycerol kinase|nr:MAG: glycerol kinase [Gammaproteobacteria bacterium SG8_30]